MPALQFPTVLVIGSVVMDIIYTADTLKDRKGTIPARDMVFKTTPCRRTRMSIGGVGRNVSEALGRLGVRTWMISVVGGVTAESRGAEIDNNEDAQHSAIIETKTGIVPDTTGAQILRQLSHLMSTGETWDSPPPPVQFFVSPIPNAVTASMTVLIGGDDQLAAAAEDMAIIEDYLIPGIIGIIGVTALLLRIKGALQSEEWKQLNLKKDIFDKIYNNEMPPYERINSVYKDILQLALNSAYAINERRLQKSQFTRLLAIGLLTTVKWIVLEANASYGTLAYISRLVVIARDIRALILNIMDVNIVTESACAEHYNYRYDCCYPLVALDPFSTIKCTHSIPILPLITVLKPNIFEAVTLATALCMWRHVAREFTHITRHEVLRAGVETFLLAKIRYDGFEKESGSNFWIPPLDIILESEKYFFEKYCKSLMQAALEVCPLPHVLTEPIKWKLNNRMIEATKSRKEFSYYINTLSRYISDRQLQDIYKNDSLKVNPIPSSLQAESSEVHPLKGTAYYDTGVAPTEKEYRFITRLNDLGMSASKILVEVGGVSVTICSLGKGGCVVAERSTCSKATSLSGCCASVKLIRGLNIPTSHIVRISGVGDSFLSGYIYGELTQIYRVISSANSQEDTNLTYTKIHNELVEDKKSNHNKEVNNILHRNVSFSEKCALHAAASALQSKSVINPLIYRYVTEQWVTPPDTNSKL